MSDLINRADAIKAVMMVPAVFDTQSLEPHQKAKDVIDALSALPSADAVQGEWVSEIDTGTRMLKCSVCGCRVQEEKYRIAVGEKATKCPYCGAELGLGGYSYDEYGKRSEE